MTECSYNSPLTFYLNFPKSLTQLSLSLSLPVCVESFGYASSRDVEARLRIGVRQSREGRHLLHLPPAELFQSICAPLQQGRREQVPQRSADIGTDLSVEVIVNSKEMQRWCEADVQVPLQLLVVPLVGVAAGQNHGPGEPAGFDPRHKQLTELFGFCLRLKQILPFRF